MAGAEDDSEASCAKVIAEPLPPEVMEFPSLQEGTKSLGGIDDDEDDDAVSTSLKSPLFFAFEVLRKPLLSPLNEPLTGREIDTDSLAGATFSTSSSKIKKDLPLSAADPLRRARGAKNSILTS
mmetsp:Transcript_96065/g.151942  ORF Transcript_96065/g.151942 Transcript_96065/m.151942 type:complete len:124 (+) Transcript_96065:406-777(+)